MNWPGVHPSPFIHRLHLDLCCAPVVSTLLMCKAQQATDFKLSSHSGYYKGNPGHTGMGQMFYICSSRDTGILCKPKCYTWLIALFSCICLVQGRIYYRRWRCWDHWLAFHGLFEIQNYSFLWRSSNWFHPHSHCGTLRGCNRSVRTWREHTLTVQEDHSLLTGPYNGFLWEIFRRDLNTNSDLLLAIIAKHGFLVRG